MGKTTLLLCLVLVVLSVNTVQCRRWFGGGSRGSSWGRSSSSHRSTPYTQPRPAITTWGSGSSASRRHDSSSNRFSSGSRSLPVEFNHKYPSPINRLPGSGTSSLGSGYKYPPSQSGLYGFESLNKYPPSPSGLSGSGSSLFGSGSKYPLSPSGLSGSRSSSFGSGSKYPPSQSGLSGIGSVNKYPSSPSRLSGSGSSLFGSDSKYPPSPSRLSGSGSSLFVSDSKYPPSPSRLSGSGPANKYRPSPSGLSGSGPANKYPTPPSGASGSGSSGVGAVSPILHGNKYFPSLPVASRTSSVVHTYPPPRSGLSGAEIQRSGKRPYVPNINNFKQEVGHSPTNELNNNRRHTYESQSNYHQRGNSYPRASPVAFSYPTTYYSSPQYVYITEYRKSNSPYSDILAGLALYNLGRSHNHHIHDHYYYDDFYRRRYLPTGTSTSNANLKNEAMCAFRIKTNESVDTLKIPCEIVSTFTKDGKVQPTIETRNSTVCVTNTTVVNNTLPNVATNTSLLNSTVSNGTYVNTTTCTSAINVTDPLRVQGPPINSTSNMECTIIIVTKEARSVKNVDCKILREYSKMPEPKKENLLLPSRSKLKSWLSNPPWWMSLFIAV